MVWAGCFKVQPSKGGGQISRKHAVEASQRTPNPFDIDVPAGYRVELVVDELTFPSGVAFGNKGETYVVETGYSYGEKLTTPRAAPKER